MDGKLSTENYVKLCFFCEFFLFESNDIDSKRSTPLKNGIVFGSMGGKSARTVPANCVGNGAEDGFSAKMDYSRLGSGFKLEIEGGGAIIQFYWGGRRDR